MKTESKLFHGGLSLRTASAALFGGLARCYQAMTVPDWRIINAARRFGEGPANGH